MLIEALNPKAEVFYDADETDDELESGEDK